MKKNQTELDVLNQISLKLDKLIGLVAVSAINEQKKKIVILKNLGFSISETSAMTGQTIDVVKKERSKLKDSK